MLWKCLYVELWRILEVQEDAHNKFYLNLQITLGDFLQQVQHAQHYFWVSVRLSMDNPQNKY